MMKRSMAVMLAMLAIFIMGALFVGCDIGDDDSTLVSVVIEAAKDAMPDTTCWTCPDGEGDDIVVDDEECTDPGHGGRHGCKGGKGHH